MTHRFRQLLYLNFVPCVQDEPELEREPGAGGGTAQGRKKKKRYVISML